MKLFVSVICCAFLFGSSVCCLSYRNAVRIPYSTIERVHQYAVSVNDETGLNLIAENKSIGKYNLEGGNSVICAFLKDVSDVNPRDIISFIVKSFSDKEVIMTGYGAGANYASKIADILSKRPDFEQNQVKLIIFCAKSPLAEDLHEIALSCTLHFSHAFDKVNFYASKAIEIPVSKLAEAKSKVNFYDIASCVVGIGLLGASCFFDSSNKKSILFISGLGIIGLDSWAIVLRKPQQYLSDSSVVEAYRRAAKKARFAEFDLEWRTIGK